MSLLPPEVLAEVASEDDGIGYIPTNMVMDPGPLASLPLSRLRIPIHAATMTVCHSRFRPILVHHSHVYPQRFGTVADSRLTMQTSLMFSTNFWLNKYVDKELFWALHVS